MNTTVFCKKNKVFIILMAIVLIIPTLLAIHFNLNLNLSGKHLDKSTSVMITTPSGELYSVENDSDIKLFSDIVTFERTNIDETSRDFNSEKPFKVEFIKESGEHEVFEFYMENTVDGCVFKDQEGLFYLINNDKAITLLKKQEFSSVNGNTVVPYALISKANGMATELAPVSGSWSFLEANGEYKTESLSESTASSVPEIRISLSDIGTLSFLSTETATNTTVTLSQNGIVKHEGKYENLLNANVMSENDAYYDLEIKAEWAKSDSRGYYGEVVYKAKLLYDVAPTYELIYRGNVSKGDFTIIKMQNFNLSDTLYLQSDFPFPTELKVFPSDKGYSFAFLPASFTDAASGKYNITLTPTDGTSQTLSATVKDGRKPATVSQNMLISDVNLQTAFTEEAVNEIKTIFAEKTANTETYPLWDGKFVYPDSENKGKVGNGMAHFGTKRSIMGLYQTEYIHEGIDIGMNTGDNVLAANNGKVVYAGNTKLLGNLVIVDHGCSIFSYYGHLDSLLVKENDVVSKSGVIGTAGSTGFAASFDGVGSVPTPQVHFAISVEGTFVNPYYFWKVGVSFDED